MDRDDSSISKLRITAYETINNLIEVAPMDTIPKIKEIVNPFLGKLEESFHVRF